jgi:flavin reductase (DIM6/NTAB) family NADH-FMN oxidoreductase RutF/DNA-binding IclR family transcriptional regulator
VTIIEQPDRIDPQLMRDVLGHYPTGVTVITARSPEGRPEAMTVGTFMSVSLDPALVAFLPARSSRSFARLRRSPAFCVNVLGADQEALCRTFASSAEDKFSEVEWRASPSGSPIVDGAIAWIDADLDRISEIGDHFLVVGRIRALDVVRPALPLLFFERGYGRFAPLQFAAGAPAHLFPLLRAVEAARPILERTAETIGSEIVVTAAVDDQLVHVAVIGHTSIHPSPLVGRRLPLAPPLGSLLVANADEGAQDAWLRRSSRAGEDGDRESLAEQLRLIRSKGWVLARKSPRHDELDNMLEVIADDVRTPAQGRALMRLLDELRQAYDESAPAYASQPTVRMLAVPVRDGCGRVPFQIGVHDVPGAEDDVPLGRIRAELERAALSIGGLPSTRALGQGDDGHRCSARDRARGEGGLP